MKLNEEDKNNKDQINTHVLPEEIYQELIHLEQLGKDESLESIEKALDYTMNPSKTVELVTGINCSPDTAYAEMLFVKSMYNKLEGRQYAHFVHSFHPLDQVTPQQAHDISVRLAKEFERFAGFQIIVGTHLDKAHIHSHFVINSVNEVTGRKWQQSPWQMQKLKIFSDELSKEYGLSIVEAKTGRRVEAGEYRARLNEQSWKHETRLAVDLCMKNSTSREDFISKMNRLGYKVKWTDTRKNITFTPPVGRPIREDTLDKTWTKDTFLNAFKLNAELGDPVAMAEQIKHMETAYALVKISRLSQEAETGDAWAQYKAGRAYIKGEEIPKDIPKAESYYSLSAEQGNKYAQYALGKMYLDGKEVNQNLLEGVRLIRASADQGSKIAQYQLGKCYLFGQGVERSVNEAEHWFTLSASQGNLYAEQMLEWINQYRKDNELELFLIILQFTSGDGYNGRQTDFPLSRLEGHALREKILELQFGSTLKWDRGQGYER